MARKLASGRTFALRTVSEFVRSAYARLRLRTKLLYSFVLLTTCLTTVTLLVLRREAEGQVQRQIEQDTRNAILTFQTVLRQQQSGLARKADLLASVALMRDGDATAITDAGDDPWKSEDCNLFVLADANGQIVALRSTNSALSVDNLRDFVSHSVRHAESSAWWSTRRGLYEVALQPYYEDPANKRIVRGTLVAGRLVDEHVAADFARLAGGDVAFVNGVAVVNSTLGPLKEMDFTRQLHEPFTTAEISLVRERYYASSLDLTPGQKPATQLVVMKSYREADAFLEHLNRLLLGLGLLTIVAGGTLIFLISDSITQPLAALMRGVHALERGDYKYPLHATGADELAELSQAFDAMRGTLLKNAEQREVLEGQLRQAHKMEALGRLAGGVAHDFNNLLTVIRGHSEILLDRVGPGDTHFASAEQIRKTADRAASLTRQMLAFSRRQVLQPKVLDVNELVVEMAKLLRRLVREDIEFSFRLGDSLAHVKADPGQLEQVLLNLTVNASDAMPLGGKLTIDTQNIDVDAPYLQSRPSLQTGSYVMISVSDTGHGMDTATKARIFEPFFTTKEPGKGTGLGLATVYGVVKQSGGSIWVESSPGNGTRFEVYLPQTSEGVKSLGSEASAKISRVRRETVLVVEDDLAVRELACDFLKSAGYSALTACDGIEAMEIAQRYGKEIQVVLTDIVMPKMRGPELAKQLTSLLPHLRIIYMTGYLEENDAADDALRGARFLQKPFSRDSLTNCVCETTKQDNLQKHPAETIAV